MSMVGGKVTSKSKPILIFILYYLPYINRASNPLQVDTILTHMSNLGYFRIDYCRDNASIHLVVSYYLSKQCSDL